jgi:hypothetical protein
VAVYGFDYSALSGAAGQGGDTPADLGTNPLNELQGTWVGAQGRTACDAQPTHAAAHTLTLIETAGGAPWEPHVTYRSTCSCGWQGGDYGTDLRDERSFWDSDPAECKASAKAQGDEHRAGQS